MGAVCEMRTRAERGRAGQEGRGWNCVGAWICCDGWGAAGVGTVLGGRGGGQDEG